MAQYQIRRTDGKWWNGADWVPEQRRAVMLTLLPLSIPTTSESSPYLRLAKRDVDSKDYVASGKVVARAVHVGG